MNIPFDEQFTVEQMLQVAVSLDAGVANIHESEYTRGVCELIGRLLMDEAGIGDGTFENSCAINDELERRLTP